MFNYLRTTVTAVLIFAALLLPANLDAANTVQVENAKAGSSDWQLADPATNHEIEGYASLAGVSRGGQISFFVNTADPTFTLEVFRVGWYGGAGARRMMAPVQLTGTKQTIPAPDPTTGIVECQWTNPYTLNIPNDTSDSSDWASGVYLARLTGSSGKQSYIIFVVRDDTRAATYVAQMPFNTFQAYNNWGGKSLYIWNSTNSIAAVNVSFNRPYAFGNQPNSASGVGAGEFLTNVQPSTEGMPAGWSYNMVRFLEREGYDVAYVTDVDAHENASLLLNHKAVLVIGHSEYWSWQMRANVQAARDAGEGLGFFSANTCYWQVRFGPSAITGAADRTIIAYKETAINDPDLNIPSLANLTTTLWRSAPVNLPEDALVGVMYGTDEINSDIIVTNPTHWVYTYTGLQNGAHLPGILGYEIDYMQGDQPASTVGVADELTAVGVPADTTVYTAASGATVFAAGSFQWSWGLDDYNVPNVRPSVINPAVQQITRNVLAKLINQAFSPALSIIPTPRVQAATIGQGVTYNVAVTSFGYSPTVTLSLSGLPSNVSYSFSPATLSGSGTSTLTIAPGSSLPIGTNILTINANDGTQTRTEAVTLNVTPTVIFFDSQETQCENGAAVNAVDGSTSTIWHTQYCPTIVSLPHEIQLDLGVGYLMRGFRYLPRQDGGINGRIGQYAFYVTNDLSSWGVAVAAGTFANDATQKTVMFTPGTYRYVRLQALTEANGGPWTSASEISILQPSQSLSSITVTPTNPAISVGTTQQFAAMGTYLVGGTLDISSQVSWGSSSGAATINGGGLATAQSAGSATISATLNEITGSTSLTVTAVSAKSLALSPTSLTGGASSTATVTLTKAAPSGGTKVTLSSSNAAAATVPASVTVAAGSTTATFNVSTSAVAATTTVTISATAGASVTASLTVQTSSTSAAASGLTLSPVTVIGGSSSTATVTLTKAAPSGGTKVTLSSSNAAAATVPTSVTVAAGSTTATFNVSTSAVTATTTVTISATAGASVTASLTVQTSSTSAAASGLTLSPVTVIGGSSSTATVTLTKAARAAGPRSPYPAATRQRRRYRPA